MRKSLQFLKKEQKQTNLNGKNKKQESYIGNKVSKTDRVSTKSTEKIYKIL